jgi:hypothetical protein
MRRGSALLCCGLLAGLLAGCAIGVAESPGKWVDRFRPTHVPEGPDVVVLEVALLERAIGDPFINEGLWQSADEQAVPLERKAILDDNGFRIGQIGGLTPAGLQTLLTSERSCVNPRRLFPRAANATTISLGPKLAACRFDLHQDGLPVAVALEGAECTLEVVPALAAEGQTRLQFTPRIRHGETKLLPRAAPDQSRWMLQEDRPTETYPLLGWEVTLAPNEYLVVGTRLDRPGSLGHQCFVRPKEAAPVQRLLVLRSSRVGHDLPTESADAPEDDPSRSISPPLALQAGWVSARGTAR